MKKVAMRMISWPPTRAPFQRHFIVPLLAGALLLGAAAPAEIPDHPVKFIKVDELKAMMDRGQKVVVVDVRSREEYEDVHIKGAKSVPIRALEQRARAELSKTVPVVFY